VSDILTLSDVTKSYGDTAVLSGVSLTAQPGETVAVVGPSGSGKSTLLNIIGALEKPTSGTVRLGETDVTALEGKALAAFRAATVGFVFQDHHLLPQLTALENVLLPTLAARTPPAPPSQGGDWGGAHARELLKRIGVERRADAFPAQMSGGERQRVAVARALINGPKLLLCDEPTGNLDRETGAEIVSLLLELAERQGATVLMVTHNTEHAARFARCLRLSDGRLAPPAPGEQP
jgi:ABC-type lipoprotein export system ATPase subunit